MAAEIERLVAREDVAPEDVCVLVRSIRNEGQAVAVALEERAVPHRLAGAAAFFQRAEVRDLLAWLRLLVDPGDAGAVVRALARPPVELRAIDIARCTQIARRRKLDMVAALGAALESPQIPPEARERIRTFFKLYRAASAALDSARPDLYVHRLIERLGLRRQLLFAASVEVVERLVNLAKFAELAAAYVRRSPQATAREFARSIAAVAEAGLREEEAVAGDRPVGVQVMAMHAAKGLEFSHVFVLGLMRRAHAGPAAPHARADPRRAAQGGAAGRHQGRAPRRDAAAAAHGDDARARAARARLPRDAPSAAPARRPRRSPRRRARRSAASGRRSARSSSGPPRRCSRPSGCCATSCCTTVSQVGGRLGELRFDTDLDVSHAVVRYLELIKLAALLERAGPGGAQSVADALPEVNARLLQAATAEQREIFETSALDEYLLDAERDERLRARAVAARTEPSLESFLPRRGDGLMLSAGDIETYRTCPLKYKFARVFRIPSEPTLNQRFGILVHQVLERFHAGGTVSRSLPELLGLLEAGWRRGGFGDSEEERQLRTKATNSLIRYHERFQGEEAEPVWFERAFQFKMGPHLLRGRVDRVDRLPGGGYELIDYKTGRPKTRRAAARGRPALALRGRRARVVAARGRPPGLLLRARRREGPGRALRGGPRLDHRDGARGRRRDPGPGLRADPVVRRVLDVRLPDRVPGGGAVAGREYLPGRIVCPLCARQARPPPARQRRRAVVAGRPRRARAARAARGAARRLGPGGRRAVHRHVEPGRPARRARSGCWRTACRRSGC